MNLIRHTLRCLAAKTAPNEGLKPRRQAVALLALTLSLLTACTSGGANQVNNTNKLPGDSNNGNALVTFQEEVPALVASNLKVQSFEPIYSSSEGANDGRPSHLYNLRGISLEQVIGSQPSLGANIGADEIGAITDQLLTVNRDLIGLPAGAGHLARTRVKIDDTNIGVLYEQQSSDSRLPVFGSMVKVNYNENGEASSLLNITYRNIDGLPAARLSADEVKSRVPSLLTSVEDHGTIRSFRVEEVKVEKLGILPVDSGLHRVAYQVLAEGKIAGGNKENHSAFTAFVDAANGQLLKHQTALAHAFNQQGSIEHYDGDPFAPTVYTMPVWGLDSNYTEMRAGYMATTNGTLQGPASSSNYLFTPTAWPTPYDYYMADTTAFKAITDLQRNLVSSGFANLMANNQVSVDAMDWTIGTSAYSQITNQIYLDNAIIDAFDRTLVGHEYGHAIHCAVGGGSTYGCALDLVHLFAGAIGEGSADYLGTSAMNSVVMGPWFAQDPINGARRLDTSKTLDNWFGVIHIDGAIWGTAFWNLRKAIGADADRLATQFLYHVTPYIDFHGGLEAVIQADQDLFLGKYASTIRKIWSFAKVYGTATPPTWFTPFLSSDARPYPNNYSSTKSYSIPGANGLWATFDPHTRVNENDSIVITNGNDQPIAGSPFLKESLRGKTVFVPGDEIKITLNSLPTDNLGGAGYLVTNIAASNPANIAPNVVMSASGMNGFDPYIVQFNFASSSDPDGNLVQCNLDPGDGSPLVTLDYPLNKAVRLTYRRNGANPISAVTNFVARGECTDNSGATVSVTKQIKVKPHNPNGGVVTFSRMVSFVQAIGGGGMP